MKKKAYIILVAFMLLIGVACTILGISVYKKKYSTFQTDGYVLETNNSQKYYFNTGNQYKISDVKEKVTLEDTDSKNHEISDESFIHYSDGSFSQFKKSVVLDTSNISKATYYNVYEESIFTNQNGNYSINYLDKQLSFKNMLVKIGSDKYMIVGKGIKLKKENEEKTTSDNYFELTYVDGNVVKIQNSEIDETLSGDKAQIIINDTTYIDLGAKKIISGDTELNLGEITIESDDNIEIPQDEDNLVVDSTETTTTTTKKKTTTAAADDEDDETGSNSNNKLHQGVFDEVANGTIDTGDLTVEQVVEENAAIKDASFKVTDFSVTANAMSVSIEITDEASVLTGGIALKVRELNTNKVVKYLQDVSGKNNITFEATDLKPETTYIFTANSDYSKNDIKYNKDFIQKTFVTSSLGITIEKEYIKKDSISLNINKSSSSKTDKICYTLTNNKDSGFKKEGCVTLSSKNNSDNLLIEGLSSNSTYHFEITSAVNNSNEILGTLYSNDYTTLKKSPQFDSSTFAIDRISSKAIIYFKNVSDPDVGVKGYVADIYDSAGNYVTSRETTSRSELELQFSSEKDAILKFDNEYMLYTYAIFDNNEIEYEIPTGAQTLSLLGSEAPIVTFEEKGKDSTGKTGVTHDKIEGTIKIDDTNNKLIIKEKGITVTYRNLSLGTDAKSLSFDISGESSDIPYDLPIKINNLKANTSYYFEVRGYLNYKSNNSSADISEDTAVVISSFIINTKIPSEFVLKAENKTAQYSNQSFYVVANLGSADSSNISDYEASTLRGITVKFFKSTYDEDDACTPKNKCWSTTFYDDLEDGVPKSSKYQSTLKEKFYDKSFVLTPSSLNISSSDITYGEYILRFETAYDYTTWGEGNGNLIEGNEFVINNADVSITPNSSSTSSIDLNNPVIIKSIVNQEDNAETNLERDTLIGYTAKTNKDTSSQYDYTNTCLYSTENTNKALKCVKKYADENGDPQAAEFYFDSSIGFVRGGSYIFKTLAKIKNDKTTDSDYTDEKVSDSTYISDKYTPEKQEPKAEFYLSTRDDSNLVYKYKIIDIDNAITNSSDTSSTSNSDTSTTNDKKATILFNNDDVGTVYDIKTNTKNYETLTIPNFKSGRIIGKTSYVLKSDGITNTLSLINQNYLLVYNSYSPMTYTLESNENNMIITYSGIDNDMYKKYLLYADITFKKNDRTILVPKVEIKRVENDSSVSYISTVPFSKVLDFKSEGETDDSKITTDIILYFDTKISGMETSDDIATHDKKNYGYLIRDIDSGTSKYRYLINKWDPLNYSLEVIDANDEKSTVTTVPFSIKNGYLNSTDEKNNKYTYEFVKLGTTTASCVTENCSTSFDYITPTINVSSAEGEVSTADISYEITNVEKSYQDSMEVYFDAYECLDDDCSTTSSDMIEKTISYKDVTDTIKLDNLTPGKKYVLKIRFAIPDKDGNKNKEEFLFDSESLGRSSNIIISTTRDVGIINPIASYVGKLTSDTNIRNLKLTYDLSYISGYTGIKYEVYKLGSSEKVDFTISDSTVDKLQKNNNEFTTDIKDKLPANQTYQIKIIPYINKDLEVFELKEYYVTFEFKIGTPSIKLKRSSDVYDGKFSVYSQLYDLNTNALNNSGSNYSLYVYDGDNYNDETSTDKMTLINSAMGINKGNTTNNITCANSICYMVLVYNADYDNTGVSTSKEYRYSTKLDLSSQTVIGTPEIVSGSNSDLITIGFVDSYRIDTDAKYITFSILDQNEGTIMIDNSSTLTEIVWNDSTILGVPNFNLPVSKKIEKSGAYTIVFALYDKDQKQIGNSQEIYYIKN